MQTLSFHPTSMPNSDPIYVRASVTSVCNLNCIYCPKESGMENQTPYFLRGNNLNMEDYCLNLAHIGRNGITGVSFTGGEPTVNPALPEIVTEARRIFQRVELTTNGLHLPKMLPELVSNLDIIKISLDAIDSNLVQKITQGTYKEKNRAIRAIQESCEAGLIVGVNVVVMRSNITQVPKIIEFCRNLNKTGPGTVYISLLDLYYSPEKRNFWEKEFLPIGYLEKVFTQSYGLPKKQERFGCRFLWFDTDGVSVRFKDSFSATHRAIKCQKCNLYCQEGIIGIKHSIEGWVTTCPTSEPSYGIHLIPSLNTQEVDQLLNELLKDIHSAKPDNHSFKKLLEKHNLQPVYKNDQINDLPSEVLDVFTGK